VITTSSTPPFPAGTTNARVTSKTEPPTIQISFNEHQQSGIAMIDGDRNVTSIAPTRTICWVARVTPHTPGATIGSARKSCCITPAATCGTGLPIATPTAIATAAASGTNKDIALGTNFDPVSELGYRGVVGFDASNHQDLSTSWLLFRSGQSQIDMTGMLAALSRRCVATSSAMLPSSHRWGGKTLSVTAFRTRLSAHVDNAQCLHLPIGRKAPCVRNMTLRI
jgi:hypothetical protein